MSNFPFQSPVIHELFALRNGSPPSASAPVGVPPPQPQPLAPLLLELLLPQPPPPLFYHDHGHAYPATAATPAPAPAQPPVAPAGAHAMLMRPPLKYGIINLASIVSSSTSQCSAAKTDGHVVGALTAINDDLVKVSGYRTRVIYSGTSSSSLLVMGVVASTMLNRNCIKP